MGRVPAPFLSTPPSIGRSDGQAADAHLCRGTAAAVPWTVTYRPDLDGLRGIAIGLVLLQHLRVPGMGSAGAVGVTLFFVLSGYLITSLLLAERAKTGSVSLPRFYVRRARRLLPALVALVVVVGVVMAVQGRLREYPPSVVLVMLYVGNWFPDQLGAYLGHTWSLAVEEQFYILWPLAFLLVARWPRVLLALLVVGITGAMFVRGGVVDPADQAGTIVRGDALLWGCLLAVTRWKLPAWTAPAGWVMLLGWFSFAVIAPWTFSYTMFVLALCSTLIVASSSRVYSWGPLRPTRDHQLRRLLVAYAARDDLPSGLGGGGWVGRPSDGVGSRGGHVDRPCAHLRAMG